MWHHCHQNMVSYQTLLVGKHLHNISQNIISSRLCESLLVSYAMCQLLVRNSFTSTSDVWSDFWIWWRFELRFWGDQHVVATQTTPMPHHSDYVMICLAQGEGLILTPLILWLDFNKICLECGQLYGLIKVLCNKWCECVFSAVIIAYVFYAFFACLKYLLICNVVENFFDLSYKFSLERPWI